ncbi:hypothetical protein EVAR_24038_1 [Eumeta japonica]|uniref:Uncharacterized protein n=1 Tax=Eumeta variegata TaxID=151549 RepID=A0A4C1WCC4_EUMVA|nr:hypothetical protein EVAR_24038_1 [Eumeta japonica]
MLVQLRVLTIWANHLQKNAKQRLSGQLVNNNALSFQSLVALVQPAWTAFDESCTVRPNHLDRVKFNRKLRRNNNNWLSAESLRHEGKQGKRLPPNPAGHWSLQLVQVKAGQKNTLREVLFGYESAAWSQTDCVRQQGGAVI